MESADYNTSSLNIFREVKDNILENDDYIVIDGKKYIKRSGWRKIASAFSISMEIRSFEMKGGDDTITAIVTARAYLPDGRFSDNIGICESSELISIGKTAQNTAATALTRAVNRCISDLIGNGELSAEEIMDMEKSFNTLKDEKEMDISEYEELEYKDGIIVLKHYVDNDRFKKMREYLRQFGYRFNSEKRSFIREG
jgi:HAMP domain-containing protein